MIRFILLLFLSILSVEGFSQFAKDNTVSDAIRNVVESTSDWGDYDNDGDLDLVIAGANGGLYTEIYRNDNGTFVNINAGLPGVSEGSVMWGDFDQDSDLDLLLSGVTSEGTRITSLYRNDEGVFVDHEADLLGFSAGTAQWGDYDNDDDLDIALIGKTDADNTRDLLKVYKNEAGVFSEIPMPVQPQTANLYGSVSWGDYDQDNDLDLLVTGLGANDTNDDYVTLILRNDEGVFVDAMISLPGVVYSAGVWGDYDNDGDQDIALLGEQFDGSYTTVIYQNQGGGAFTDMNASLNNVFVGSIDGGDYDNDGDQDLLITGIDGITFLPVTYIYTNDEGVFTDAGETIPGVWGIGIWGDYDNDGDLDFLISGLDENYNNELTEVYENTTRLHQSITFEAIPNKTYGDVDFDLNASASSGLPITYEVISGPATVLGNTLTITGAEAVVVEARQNGDADYKAALPVRQTFTVHKATLTATADGQSMTYGNDLPALTYTYEGFVNGEDATALTAEPTISATANSNSDTGTYEIKLSGGDADNYTFILVNGMLTINKAEVTITLSDLVQIYDGTPKEPAITTDPTELHYSVTYDGEISPPTEAGTYEVEVIVEDTNFQGEASATLSIELISGMQDVEIHPEITIYPNPTSQEIHFAGELKNLTRIQIHDLAGKIILDELMIKQPQLDISHITAGTYLLSLIDRKGTKQLTQIIIK